MVSRTGFSNCYEWRAYDRRKYDRLQQDIVNMGVMPMAGWESSFQMWPEAKLLGAAYVSEGSSLGGKVILKHLRKQAFFKENQIGTFLSSNSEKTGEAWKAFVSLLEREGAADHEGVISGAVEAFEMFIQIAEQVKQKRK